MAEKMALKSASRRHDESLPNMIARIHAERGTFRNITEHGLEESILRAASNEDDAIQEDALDEAESNTVEEQHKAAQVARERIQQEVA